MQLAVPGYEKERRKRKRALGEGKGLNEFAKRDTDREKQDRFTQLFTYPEDFKIDESADALSFCESFQLAPLMRKHCSKN